MTLQDYLRVLREQWLVVAIALVLGLAGAAGTFLLRAPDYTAKMTMYVSSQPSDNTSVAYLGAQLSRQRVTSYVELITSRRTAEGVVAQLHLAEAPEQLLRRVTAANALDSVVIEVSVVDKSDEQAARIANAFGDVFSQLVSEIEKPIDSRQAQAVVARVFQFAKPPTTPSSIGITGLLAIGLAAGAAVGFLLAIGRNMLDTRVKSGDQLVGLGAGPALGSVAVEAKSKASIMVFDDPGSPRAEAYRKIRTNMRFVGVDSPQQVVLVTSPLPGDGKSTTTVNLAISHASTGSRVLIVEADLRRPTISKILGIEQGVGLTTALTGRGSVSAVIQSWGAGLLDVLPCGPLPPNPAELLGSQRMVRLLADLRNRYDLILVDTPPLLPVADTVALAPAVDGVIVLSRYKKAKASDVATALVGLRQTGVLILGHVLTMAPKSNPHSYASYYNNSSPNTAPVNGSGSARQELSLSDEGSAPESGRTAEQPRRRPTPHARR